MLLPWKRQFARFPWREQYSGEHLGCKALHAFLPGLKRVNWRMQLSNPNRHGGHMSAQTGPLSGRFRQATSHTMVGHAFGSTLAHSWHVSVTLEDLLLNRHWAFGPNLEQYLTEQRGSRGSVADVCEKKSAMMHATRKNMAKLLCYGDVGRLPFRWEKNQKSKIAESADEDLRVVWVIFVSVWWQELYCTGLALSGEYYWTKTIWFLLKGLAVVSRSI